MNILAIKNGELDEARRDLEAVIDIARGRALVKAIYEQCLYSDDEKVKALEIARYAGADYVKISNALSGKKLRQKTSGLSGVFWAAGSA
jgi:deoxyribose-phosphate aldolase